MSKHTEFKRCVAFLNPASASRHRGNTFIKQLAAIFPAENFEIIETTDQDYKNTAGVVKKLSNAIKGETLLCVAGGDGSVSFVVNQLLGSDKLTRKASRVTVLPLWGGNANDLAHMANGSSRRTDMAKILDNGHKAKIFPLEIIIKHRRHTRTHWAICYTSFGTSAHTIHKMNKPSYRKKRLYRLGVTRLGVEMASVTRALMGAKPFKSKLQGKERHVYDLILINGSRMAKVTRGPGKLTEPAFYELRVHRKHPIVLMYAGLLIGNRSFIKRRNTSVEIEVQDGTWAQMDGEVIWIPKNSTIQVNPSKKSVNLLSTKLR